MGKNSGNNIIVRRFKWYIRVWKFLLKLDEYNQKMLDEAAEKIVEEARRIIPHDTGYLRGRALATIEEIKDASR